jgi:hypothetical protein
VAIWNAIKADAAHFPTTYPPAAEVDAEFTGLGDEGSPRFSAVFCAFLEGSEPAPRLAQGSAGVCDEDPSRDAAPK